MRTLHDVVRRQAELRTRIGLALRTMRENAGLSQDQVASALGLAGNDGVSRIESGATRVFFDQVCAFETACGQPYGTAMRLAGIVKEPKTATAAIKADPRLTDTARDIVLAAYRVAVSRSSSDGG